MAFGSYLNNPDVQKRLEIIGQMEPAQDPVQATGLPYGSFLNNQKVQQAMDAVNQASQQPAAIPLQTIKNALNGGELAPDVQARYDLPRYQLGCELLLNMIPLPTGGITKRPPLRHIAFMGEEAGARSRHTRLIPFIYSASLQCMLALVMIGGYGAKLYWIDRDGKDQPHESVTLPFAGDEIFECSHCQCGKVIYFAHHNHKPFKITCESWNDGPNFKYEEVDFKIKTPSPAMPSCWGHGVWNNDYLQEGGYVATAINAETGEESLPSPVFVTNCPHSGWYQDIRVTPVPGCKEYRIYKKQGGSFGFIGRLVEGQEMFVDDGISPDMEDPPPANPDNCFDKTGDYPSVVFIHQQRLGWAATDNQPLTIWMSQTSNFECRAAKTPPNDDDAIEATLASTQANRILWAIPDRTGLAFGTEGGEWYMTGADGGDGVSPNSISFQPQTSYGSEEFIEPVRCASSLVFCQRGGHHARDLGYSFQSDRYEAQDLMLLASHLFRNTKVRYWAWQGGEECVLWIVAESGQLLGLTYMPEHEVTAWHRHESPYGDFHSVACLDDSEGRPRLWAIVLRTSGGAQRYSLEMLEPRYQGQPSEYDYDRTPVEIPVYEDGPDKLAYRARCIPCLPEQGMQDGASLMRIRKINSVKARVIHSRPFFARVESQNAEPTRFMPVPYVGQTSHLRLARTDYADAADWPCPLGAGFREGAKLILNFDGPDPVTVLGLSITCELATNGGGQV